MLTLIYRVLGCQQQLSSLIGELLKDERVRLRGALRPSRGTSLSLVVRFFLLCYKQGYTSDRPQGPTNVAHKAKGVYEYDTDPQ